MVNQSLSLFHLSKHHCSFSSLGWFHFHCLKYQKSEQPWVDGSRAWRLPWWPGARLIFGVQRTVEIRLPTNFGSIARLPGTKKPLSPVTLLQGHSTPHGESQKRAPSSPSAAIFIDNNKLIKERPKILLRKISDRPGFVLLLFCIFS